MKKSGNYCWLFKNKTIYLKKNFPEIVYACIISDKDHDSLKKKSTPHPKKNHQKLSHTHNYNRTGIESLPHSWKIKNKSERLLHD